MTQRTRLLLALAAILPALAMLASPTVEGQLQSSSSVPPALLAKATRDGDVRVIVMLRTAFAPEGQLTPARALDQRARIEAVRTSVIDRLSDLPTQIGYRYETIPAFSALVTRTGLERLAAMAEVVSVQEDRWRKPTLAQSLVQIQGTTAQSSGYTGSGWTVAVLDTGFQKSHLFLGGATVSEACYSNAGGLAGGTSLCPGGVTSSTATNSALNCVGYEGCEHGTHVAGIAVGRTFSGGPLYNGVARAATLIAIQVFTGFPAGNELCDFGPACVLSADSDQVAGLQRVYALRDAYRISSVNMSIGGGRYTSQATCDAESASTKAAIDNLRSARIATAIASGNEYYTGALASPACISSAVSVGSVGDGTDAEVPANVVSDFSNSAPFLKLLAPGQWITAPVPGGYGTYGGTSMAAPHVAGAWALLRQRKPLASVDEVLNAFTATGLMITDTRPIRPGDPSGGAVKPRISVMNAINSIRVDYMSVDQPGSNVNLVQPFLMSGWGLNMSAPLNSGTGVDTVHVWAFPSGGGSTPIGVASYGAPRGDVGAAYGAQFTSSGWTIPVRGLRPGTYMLVAYARNTFNGTFSQSQTLTNVTVQANPRTWIDFPGDPSVVTSPFVMSGWATDFAAGAGTGVDTVHVYAYPRPGSGAAPIFVGVAQYGLARTDLGAAYGTQFTNSGWQIPISSLPPGPYVLVAYAHSSLTNTFSSYDTAFVTISQMVATIDRPSSGPSPTRTFPLSGWAVDLGAHTGSGIDAVHIYAYPNPGSGTPPVFLGLATYGTARPDVGAAFGSQFTNSGYTINVSGLQPGLYRFAVYPHSAVSGMFLLKTVDVTIP